MKKFSSRYLHWILPVVFILFIEVCRWCPVVGEGYARLVYPVVSSVLSALSALVPFSLEEWVVIGAVLTLAIYPWVARKRWQKKKIIWLIEFEIVAWIYCWFYLGWGINYFRHDFFTRSETVRVSYNEKDFRAFLHNYTEDLNNSYSAAPYAAPDGEKEIKELFRSVPGRFGLAAPKSYQQPKSVMFNSLYSAVGVLGYMGPFFAESQLNEDLLPVQHPFTYAHELSHLLGVSSEAEANFWAYQVCIRSQSPFVRYSGYFGLLPYVLANARSLLAEDEYKALLRGIRSEVWADLKEKDAYWSERYSPLIGAMQDAVYSWYLKGNKIASGQKNYAEVVGMILSLPAGWWQTGR